MLKHRILTALILAPLVIWGILSLESQWLAVGLAFFVAVGAWEWADLIGLHQRTQRFIYSVFISLLMLLVFLLADKYTLTQPILFISAVWWVISLFLIKRYRGETGINPKWRIPEMLLGVVLLVPTWLALITLHAVSSMGPQLLLFSMTLIWVADSGAYFVGRKFGKNKLAPYVSPGKSWEGVFGGMLFCAVYSALAGVYWLDVKNVSLFSFILLCVVVVAFSVVGDLAESLFKRRAGKKDSGTIFPGHGGVLDRIDSLTAAAPLFALGFILLEISV